MEVTAAERTTIYTNISPLAQRVNNYIQTQHSSIAAVAKDIGYSRTTVSRYLTGKYDSNPNDLESKPTDFLTFFFGFTLSAVMGCNLIAAAGIGCFFALINYEIASLKIDLANAPKAAIASGSDDEEEEDI